ncbi:hypothetical protein VaNZ11_005815 [Volvox africanus]|uniref:Uncharacterized protein n=1 Tax=Volvox africanus TaxID=51714 RepID=A0ABQ5S0K9_9CHLO|nr:hypothetical protein VaNZ11_005815 [Volvox africanus]
MQSGQGVHWLLNVSLGCRSSSACRVQCRVPGVTVARAGCCLAAFLAQSPRAQMSTSPKGAPAINKLLVANRGEIACRVLTTARKLGIASVAVFSEADRLAKHVNLADESYCIGGAAARDSYLRSDAILEVARRTGADAVHPGYGFLSENAAFAEACAAAGVAFVGPPAAAIRAMGDKSTAKGIMQAAGVPVVPGYHGEDQSEERLVSEGERVGFPLLVKAVSGGGGKGMKLAAGPGDLLAAIRSARREALASFNDDRLLLERYIQRPRHVEVQVFADRHGGAVYLFDRDCSVQRRHQKIIEEAPAPGLPQQFHIHIGEAAVRAARAVGYVNAGTVEFILDTDSPSLEFYFMEMNTRLQVEHPVSEAITGQDFVEWQLRVAAGLPLPLTQQQLTVRGHAFEARIYAESPRNNFLPGAGTVRRWRTPAEAVAFHNAAMRVDSGVQEGDTVGTFYDPMIAKLVVHGPDRPTALTALVEGLRNTQVAGLPTNVPFLIRLATHPAFASAGAVPQTSDLNTAFLTKHAEELLAPQHLPPEAFALAAVARHLLSVRRQSEAEAAEGLRAKLGPWALGDSKRLWHEHCRTYVVRHPEGGEGAQRRATLVVEGGGNFRVRSEVVNEDGVAAAGRGAPPHRPARRSSGHGTPNESTPPTPTPPEVSVRNTQLVGEDTLTAEIGGRKCTAQVLMYGSGSGGAGVPVEQALDVWLDGDHYHFTWSEPIWSRKAGGMGAAAAGGAVAAPMPGRVVAVLAAEGTAVKAGGPLVALEAMKMEHIVLATSDGVVEQVLVSPGMQVAQGQVMAVVTAEKKATGQGREDKEQNYSDSSSSRSRH